MKKKNFIDGAIIGTISLVLCKILGLIYVIPFYKIIGPQGGALYSYAYSIYAVFLNLSTVGIPAAIAKIICEYDTLNYQESKQRAFKLASRILNFVGIISFIIMFIFATPIAESIIGGVTGGNSVHDVAVSIRCVAFALLVVPRLSILKGYFQGNKYITQSSVSAIIEQAVRVSIIIVGSLVTVKVFHLPIEYAVYVATFSAAIAALSAYIYLRMKSRTIREEDLKKIENEKKSISKKSEQEDSERNISTKNLVKKIIVYALPFVIISLLSSAYNIVDTFTVVKTLTKIGYSTQIAETTISVMNTWAAKLNQIVLSISLGMAGSLIPNIVESYTKKDFKEINHRMLLAFKMLIYLTVPMAFGMSFLAEPVWHVFYDTNAIGYSIYRFYVLQVIIHGLFTTMTTITQSMNQTKITIGSLVASLILKATLNIPLMYLFKVIGIPSYYAPTAADAIAKTISLIAVLIILKKKYEFSYKPLLPYTLKTAVSLGAMLVTLFLIKLVYFNSITVVKSVITITIYTVAGAIVYFIVSNKFKLLEDILGPDYKNKLLKKFKIKRSWWHESFNHSIMVPRGRR